MKASEFGLAKDLGQEVSFTTYNPSDPTVYIGEIKEFATYDKASAYGNMIAYNQACRLTNAVHDPIPDDVRSLSFFIVIKLTNVTQNQLGMKETRSVQGAGDQRFYAFAPEWINGDSFRYLNQDKKYTFWVMNNPNADPDNILNILREAGYTSCGFATTN